MNIADADKAFLREQLAFEFLLAMVARPEPPLPQKRSVEAALVYADEFLKQTGLRS